MKVAMMRKRDDEEEEVMTEEQKMEEGKRMFEQGGFTACREKVAQDAGARGRRQDRSRNVRLRSGMRPRRQKIRESNRSSPKNLRRLVGTPRNPPPPTPPKPNKLIPRRNNVRSAKNVWGVKPFAKLRIRKGKERGGEAEDKGGGEEETDRGREGTREGTGEKGV
ncbi:hypothetical protein F5879DRAFT_270258 [Lentinula edodes]|nr:hypothetical protein F5879DRAFT_270258 [Lentinula edodes]